MASILYVTEYQDVMRPDATLIPVEPGVDQTPLSVSTAVASTAFKSNTRFVRLNNDGGGAICIAFGTAPTASTNNKRMSAGATEYFAVPVGQAYKVSAISVTA